jgi:hypothetical protein
MVTDTDSKGFAFTRNPKGDCHFSKVFTFIRNPKGDCHFSKVIRCGGILKMVHGTMRGQLVFSD